VVFYVGKALQLAGLLAVGIALFTGVVDGESRGSMARELGGAAFGFLLFWAGRMIESR
jgi:hypothetical protein